MNRDYTDGEHNGITFFVGEEVEHSFAKGMRTLFITGIQSHDAIVSAAECAPGREIEHLYFGANQSFDPKEDSEFAEWEAMIKPFLKDGTWVTLDIDVKHAERMLEMGLTEYNTFIPMISVKLPYINQYGYNAVVKIDDKDFKASNPGVWCLHLHQLMSPAVFTHWNDYGDDEVIK